MNLAERVSHLQELWLSVMPHIPVPGLKDIAYWYSYPIETIEAAIMRTAAKFAKEKIATDFKPKDAFSYVTGYCRIVSVQQAMERSATADNHKPKTS